MKILTQTYTFCFVVFVTSVLCNADTFTFDSAGTDVRLVTEPSGARNDNNGGNTSSGALIGLNTSLVNNYMLYRINGLNPLSLGGQAIESATLTFTAAGIAPNAGNASDLINLHEISLSNAGWISGNGEITGADTPADNGSVSFANRVQYDGSGVTMPWLDAGGAGVANLLGAIGVPIGSQPGYTTASTVVTFNLSPALVQGWVDNGLAGVALSVTDSGDNMSRFNFVPDAANLTVVTAIPEPSGLFMLGSLSMLALIRKRR